MTEQKKTKNLPMANTHFRLKSKIAALVHAGFFLQMLEIVELCKIETQLMCPFQLIIGWPIFWIYYQGHQRSRSCVKVKSNVNLTKIWLHCVIYCPVCVF